MLSCFFIPFLAVLGHQISQLFPFFCEDSSRFPKPEFEQQLATRSAYDDRKIDCKVHRDHEAAEEAQFVANRGIRHEWRKADHVVQHEHDDDLVYEFNPASLLAFQRLHCAY